MPGFSAKAWLIMGISAAIALACYPTLSAAWAAHLARNQESSAISRTDEVNASERQESLEQARAYNALLAGEERDGTVAPYEEQLRCSGVPEMCWLEFPKASIRVAVYHGTDDSTLMKGAGHLKGSALPVGGTNTHCVITGHSGMRDILMFDKLTQVVAGDVFTIHVMGEHLSYRVVDIRTVSPDDVAFLAPQKNRDLCTLVTCTSSPTYGDSLSQLNDLITRKNDLRLLVTGERCAYEPLVPIQTTQSDRGWAAAIAAPALLAFGIIVSRLITHARRAHQWRWKTTRAPLPQRITTRTRAHQERLKTTHARQWQSKTTRTRKRRMT